MKLVSSMSRRTMLVLGFLLGFSLSNQQLLSTEKLSTLLALRQQEAALQKKSSSSLCNATSSEAAVVVAIKSGFDVIVQAAQEHTFRGDNTEKTLEQEAVVVRKKFDISAWKLRSDGGLLDKDREMLGRIYGEAESVFEYGLGESTRIANFVGVKRYAGIDSDPVWVASTRKRVASHFRFYLADIGETRAWGYPREKLTKAVLQYQLAPLLVEPEPFDVYMVDGRFRFPCLMASFLHASARGETNLTKTIVLVHDCFREYYHRADHLLEMEHSGDLLCAYRRKQNTTDDDLVRFWQMHYLEHLR